MATLQTIRNRAGILIAIIIGLALVAFVLGDMLQAGSKIMSPTKLRVAEINGQSVQYPDFQKRIEELSEVYKMNSGSSQLDDNAWNQIREQAWQELLKELVMGDVYENIGVAVSSDELYDLVQGANPHRIVQQIFRNPNTGAFDKDFAISFLKSLQTSATPEQKNYWLYVENQIVSEKTQSKYSNLISKGFYATSKEAGKSLADKNKQVSFQYIPLNYSSIPDGDVALSDKELKAYYEEHKDEYKQEKSRRIEYITFDVTASATDDEDTKKWIEDAKSDFTNAQDNAQYINVNSDTRFDDSFKKKEELSAVLGEFAFNGVVGDVYGPYKDGDSYKIAKIDAFKMIPDSVTACHILIKPESVGGPAKAKQVADSLQNLLEKGADFGRMAREHSGDPGSAMNGGEYKWIKRNQMVKPFEDAVFNGEINKITQAVTQFGIHLVKPTVRGKETKQVRLAILERKVTPSTQTYQNTYTLASRFASENQNYEAFKKAVAIQKLSKKVADVKEDEREIAGLQYSRTLIRAAYDADLNDILVNNEGSTIFEFGNSFVIAALVNITDEGISPFSEVKPRIELVLRKDKKAEMLITKAKDAISGTSLEVIASKLGSTVKTAENINFNTYSIPELGIEPAVVGTAACMSQDQVSAPVKGNNGVYVLKVLSVKENANSDVKTEQKLLSQNLGYRANYQSFEVQKKAAEIVDKRSKFY